MIILLFGPPGSGKGTHSSWLSEAYNLHHISTGDLLRKELSMGSEIGIICGNLMKEGKLVSDDLIINILMKEMERVKSNGYLLDGFPRSVAQAKALFEKKIDISLVFNLNCNQEILINRVTKRWTHPGSGRIYHEDTKRPIKCTVDKETGEVLEAFDDIMTNEKLVKRPDDTKEALLHRLHQFEENTMPILELYKDRVINVDAMQELDSIKKVINVHLEKYITNNK